MADNKEEQERQKEQERQVDLKERQRLEKEQREQVEGKTRAGTKEVGNYQTVSAKNPLDNRVILWEKDPVHPNGEVFIWGDPNLAEQPTFEAGVTPKVQKLIADGVLSGAGDPMMASRR